MGNSEMKTGIIIKLNANTLDTKNKEANKNEKSSGNRFGAVHDLCTVRMRKGTARSDTRSYCRSSRRVPR